MPTKNCEFDYNYSSVQLKNVHPGVYAISILMSDFIVTVLGGFYNVLVDDGEVNHHCVTWVRYYKILKC